MLRILTALAVVWVLFPRNLQTLPRQDHVMAALSRLCAAADEQALQFAMENRASNADFVPPWSGWGGTPTKTVSLPFFRSATAHKTAARGAP